MEPNSSKGFDPLLAVQLLLEIAEEQAVKPILKKIVEQAAERTEFVFSQVWLVEKGDLCASCKYRSECPDQTRCLHLAAGKGRSIFTRGTGLRQYRGSQYSLAAELWPARRGRCYRSAETDNKFGPAADFHPRV